ncbi:hypothetical protein GIW57_05340 [Stenotrophomonas sp. PA-6-5C]|uniref:hypothetical protein n=1 Tax=Stenotrophomonas sp. PA-6-5C TaxID=2665487 RepID=UPI001F48744A|nr:hypothetical protein [Stenotrophomonas sp. PA-6-5C]MCF5089600.1 hypothetical protein [Stenotrophomonas sp. PA-6-5C]
MKLRAHFTAALWKVTARNLLGWPTERRHRLSGRYQHIRYNETGRWTKGRLPQEGGTHGR